MRFFLWLLSVVALVLAGWIGGPVAMQSYRVATATNPERARQAVAYALLDAYRDAPDGAIAPPSTGPDTASVRECGYDPATLLREDGVPFSKSIDWDITSLNLRAGQSHARGVRDIRAESLAKTQSTVLMSALIACHDTPLESVCRGRVAQMTAAIDGQEGQALADIRAMGRDSDRRILCAYLDGAAARRGITKAAPALTAAP
ncbi:MAG: hypothetical protein H2053_05395 [Sphingomonas sp.]|nr:hypothetical protein [Sphingomonas sp.]